MGKLLLWFSLVVLLILGIGTHMAPGNPAFWLASSSNFYQYARLGVGLVVILQLVSSPPRHKAFRIFTAVFATLVFGWAWQQTYVYHMELLDLVAFTGSSMALFIAALERRNIFADVRKTVAIDRQLITS